MKINKDIDSFTTRLMISTAVSLLGGIGGAIVLILVIKWVIENFAILLGG